MIDNATGAGEARFMSHDGTFDVTNRCYQATEKRPPSREEHEAKKEQAQLVAEENLRKRRNADEAFRANFERLKAERKAREQLVSDD
jgi:hypothetical protein